MKKSYSIQNVVTYKDYMKYTPKYDLPQNRYGKFSLDYSLLLILINT